MIFREVPGHDTEITKMKLRTLSTLTACLLLSAACTDSGNPRSLDMAELNNPAAPGARYPFVVSGTDRVFMSWLEPAPGESAETMSLVWAAFDGREWSEPEVIRTSERFFVNWADFPSLAAGEDAPLAAHWLQKTEGGVYAYHVNVSLRSPAGTWSDPLVPHQDKSATEHGFVSMVPLNEGRILVIWLDGYQTPGMDHSQADHEQAEDHSADINTSMTLHSAILGSSGETLDEFEVDSSVCDCCQTTAVHSGDHVVAVYRDRTEEEIRDHYRAIFDLATNTWKDPAPLSNDGWKIPGCPVNGPQVAAFGDTVIATWFTAPNDEPRVMMAVSNDGGISFEPAEILAEGTTLGRAGVAFNASGEALLTWIRFAGGEGAVMGRLWRKSEASPAFEIGRINATRASGFPRAAALGDNFVVAFTEPDAGSKIITLSVSPRRH